MLTDLSWLGDGRQFPPAAERERIETYKLHEQLFLTKHPDAWSEDFLKLAQRLRLKPFNVETIFNYHQLLSKKISDFIVGAPPTIETEGKTDELIKLLDKQEFNSHLYEGFIDVTRYGNAVSKIVGKGESMVNPMYWFPVVAPDDLKRITQHVIAYPSKPDVNGKYTQLYVEIHEKGRIRQRCYRFEELEKKDSYFMGKIIGMAGTETLSATNLDDFAVNVLTNTTHSGSIFGLDDYAVVNSIIQKIMWRLHRADTILDKHSEPSMSGPSSALKYDERTKMYFFDLGNYFKRDGKEDPDLQYVTWDGNLESNFKEIELLFEQLYTLTEMGQAFAEGGGGGAASSARALRLRMVSPLAKAQRVASMNSASVKRRVAALAKVNGISLDYDSINIKWNDGLPVDESEEITMLVNAVGQKAVMSQFSALKKRGLSDKDIEAELEQMRTEAAASMPAVLGVVDQNTNDPNEDTSEDVNADDNAK